MIGTIAVYLIALLVGASSAFLLVTEVAKSRKVIVVVPVTLIGAFLGLFAVSLYSGSLVELVDWIKGPNIVSLDRDAWFHQGQPRSGLGESFRGPKVNLFGERIPGGTKFVLIKATLVPDMESDSVWDRPLPGVWVEYEGQRGFLYVLIYPPDDQSITFQPVTKDDLIPDGKAVELQVSPGSQIVAEYLAAYGQPELSAALSEARQKRFAAAGSEPEPLMWDEWSYYVCLNRAQFEGLGQFRERYRSELQGTFAGEYSYFDWEYVERSYERAYEGYVDTLSRVDGPVQCPGEAEPTSSSGFRKRIPEVRAVYEKRNG